MKTFYVGTGMCVGAALGLITLNLTGAPKLLMIALLPVLLTGFGLQMVAMWKMRPSVVMPQGYTPSKKPKKSAFDGPRVLGLFFALLGSIGAVAVGIYVTHNGAYLWALILVALIVQQVSTTEAEYSMKPAMLGMVMGLLCAGLGVVVWYVKDANYLWAMLLIGLLTDAIM